MRRKDREITDPAKIKEIISSCHCCRLGFNDNGRVYIVPLNFGFEEREGKLIFYFHGAREGRKMDLIRETHWAGFEMDTAFELKEGKRACDWSARFQSAIGEGRVELIEDPQEKRRALEMLMRHHTGREGWDFPDTMVERTGVFRLEVEEIACKEHE